MGSSICFAYFKFLKWKVTDCLPAWDHYFKLISIVILVFGLISNALLLLTLTRKKLIKNPNNIFLIAIAICGSIALSIYFGLFLLDQISYHYTYSWIYAWATFLPICYLVCAIHTWSTVCLAAWRVLTLDFPLENSLRMTRKRVLINIAIITLIVIAFHIPHYTNYHIQKLECASSDPVFSSLSIQAPSSGNERNLTPDGGRNAQHDPMERFSTESKVTESKFSEPEVTSKVTSNYTTTIHYISSRSKRLETIGFYIHSIGMQVVPNFFLLFFTLILLKKLAQARKRKQQLLMARNGIHNNLSSSNYDTSGGVSADQGSNLNSTSSATSGNIRPNFNRTQSDAAACAESKVVIETSHALILIFCVSLICDLPISIKILADLIRFPTMDKVIFSNITYICNIMKLLNCSLVLVLCSITSSLFRSMFLEVVQSIVRVIFCKRFFGGHGSREVESHEFKTVSTSVTK